MTLVQVSSPCVFLNFRYSSKYFAEIYRAQYGAAMLVSDLPTPVTCKSGGFEKQAQKNLEIRTSNLES